MHFLKPFQASVPSQAHSPTYPPIWIMRQAGRYLPEYKALRSKQADFFAFCYNPQAVTEATLQPIDRFDLDAAILFSDILIIPQASGINIQFKEGIGPVVKTLKSEQDVNTFTFKPDDFHQNVQPIYQAISQIRKDLNPNKALIGFCGAPFTVACYMLDNHPSKDALNIRKLAYQSPKIFQNLMDELVKATIYHLDNQIKAGANAVMLFESWASLCPPSLLNQAIFQPLFQIASALKQAHPNVPIIAFPRNLTESQLLDLTNIVHNDKTKVIDGFGLSHTLNLKWAAKNLPSTLVLQGNLDPAILFTNPQTIQTETANMLAHVQNRRQYVCNFGHGINQHTPPEHVQVFVDTVRNFNFV